MNKALLLLLGLSGLLGCQSSIYSVTQERLYSPGDFHYAAADKALQTVLWGNPSGESDTDFAQRVLTIMVQTSFDVALVRPARFTTEGGDRPEYQVVVAFNPDDQTTAADLCAKPAPTLAKRSGNGIEARMAFCWHQRVLSTSYAVLDNLEGPEDPRFGWMIQSLTRELYSLGVLAYRMLLGRERFERAVGGHRKFPGRCMRVFPGLPRSSSKERCR